MAKIYNSIDEYEVEAKIGDRIVLAGYGIMDGIENVSSKYNTYKVYKIKDDGSISIKNYRGRVSYSISACAYDQKLMLLTRDEFNKLPI